MSHVYRRCPVRMKFVLEFGRLSKQNKTLLSSDDVQNLKITPIKVLVWLHFTKYYLHESDVSRLLGFWFHLPSLRPGWCLQAINFVLAPIILCFFFVPGEILLTEDYKNGHLCLSLSDLNSHKHSKTWPSWLRVSPTCPVSWPQSYRCYRGQVTVQSLPNYLVMRPNGTETSSRFIVWLFWVLEIIFFGREGEQEMRGNEKKTQFQTNNNVTGKQRYSFRREYGCLRSLRNDVHFALNRKFFNVKHLKPVQEEVLLNFIERKSVFCVLLSGCGK